MYPFGHCLIASKGVADGVETLDVQPKNTKTFLGVAKDITWGTEIKALTHLNGRERASEECE